MNEVIRFLSSATIDMASKDASSWSKHHRSILRDGSTISTGSIVEEDDGSYWNHGPSPDLLSFVDSCSPSISIFILIHHHCPLIMKLIICHAD